MATAAGSGTTTTHIIMTTISSFEFVYGAASVIVINGLYKLYGLFQTPSVDSVETNCKKVIPVLGDSASGITIWGFEASGKHPLFAEGIPDDSPYVARVENFLRLIKQPYAKAVSQGMQENPRGKVPFANIYGRMVDDSSQIIATLEKKLDVQVDDDLKPDEVAQKHLIRQLLQGSSYWVLLHQKFDTDYGRQIFREDMAHNFPPILRSLISAFAIRGNHANLWGSGIGRMSHSDIVEKGKADLRCLSQLLGDQDYFFGGTSPTTIDADVYSWLVMFFKDKAQIHNPWILEIQNECPNLVVHTERMKTLLYPETVTDKVKSS